MTCRIFKRERSITVTLDECYDKLGTGSIIFLYSEGTNCMLCHFIIEYNIGLHRHVVSDRQCLLCRLKIYRAASGEKQLPVQEKLAGPRK